MSAVEFLDAALIPGREESGMLPRQHPGKDLLGDAIFVQEQAVDRMLPPIDEGFDRDAIERLIAAVFIRIG